MGLHLKVHIKATDMWVVHPGMLMNVLLHQHRGDLAPAKRRGLLLARRPWVAVQLLQRLTERRMGPHLKVLLNSTKMWVVHTSNMGGQAIVLAKAAMRGGPRGRGVVVHLQ